MKKESGTYHVGPFPLTSAHVDPKWGYTWAARAGQVRAAILPIEIKYGPNFPSFDFCLVRWGSRGLAFILN